MLVDRNKTTTSEQVQAEEERSQSAEPPKNPLSRWRLSKHLSKGK